MTTLFGHAFFFLFNKTIDEVESAPFNIFWFKPPLLSKGLVRITDIETLKIELVIMTHIFLLRHFNVLVIHVLYWVCIALPICIAIFRVNVNFSSPTISYFEMSVSIILNWKGICRRWAWWKCYVKTKREKIYRAQLQIEYVNSLIEMEISLYQYLKNWLAVELEFLHG